MRSLQEYDCFHKHFGENNLKQSSVIANVLKKTEKEGKTHKRLKKEGLFFTELILGGKPVFQTTKIFFHRLLVTVFMLLDKRDVSASLSTHPVVRWIVLYH